MVEERMPGQDRYWADYYEQLAKDAPQWLDYSNERVHLQTFGAVIEASDRLVGRRVLDVGCGKGLFCRIAQDLGAGSVTGIDLATSAIEPLRAAFPAITWKAGDISDPAFRADIGRFDAAFLLEVMQYLPAPATYEWLWEILDPGGMFVAVFPNENCPIVQRTRERFGGRYAPPSLAATVAWADAQPDLDTWAARGFRFQEDQRVVPYALTPWSRSLDWEAPPNRIQLVVKKAALAG